VSDMRTISNGAKEVGSHFRSQERQEARVASIRYKARRAAGVMEMCEEKEDKAR
jgi:hypothetical protein